MQAQYNSKYTRLICINSNSSVSSNDVASQTTNIFQQLTGNISPCLYPLYFPEATPLANHGQSLYTSLLNNEDVTALQKFCADLYTFELLPELERRVDFLSKHVSDHRKGVKNVLRSFWRKPSDVNLRSGASGQVEGVRYRYDSSEGQTLLLADTFFTLRDYEAALNTYRLLRDDFKTDNSTYHFGYISIMIAACQLCLDPKYGGKEAMSSLKAFKETCFPGKTQTGEMTSTVSSALCLSLLAASIYVNPVYISTKAPQDAAYTLLSAAFFLRHHVTPRSKSVEASSVSPFPLVTALLLEKAGSCFAQAKMYRKYAMYTSIAAQSFQQCRHVAGARGHALVLYAAACCVSSLDGWTSLEKVALDAILQLLREGGSELARLLLLHLYMLRRNVLAASINDIKSNQQRLASSDTTSSNALSMIFAEMVSYSGAKVLSEWNQLGIIGLLQGALPITPLCPNDGDHDIIDIEELGLPLFNMDQLSLTVAANGNDFLIVTDPLNLVVDPVYKHLKKAFLMLELEDSLLLENSNGISQMPIQSLFISKLIEYEASANSNTYQIFPFNKYGLGEQVHLRIELLNPFAFELTLTEMQIVLRDCTHDRLITEYSLCKDIHMRPHELVVVDLCVAPTCQGSFVMHGLQWLMNLPWSTGGRLRIRNTIQKRGFLKQKSLHERSARMRAEDSSMAFKVIDNCPLLTLRLTGIKDHVFDGEIIHVDVTIRNQGLLPAESLVLKVTNAHAVLLCKGSYISPSPASSSVFYLPSSISLGSGESLEVAVLIRFDNGNYDPDSLFSLLVCTQTSLQSVESIGNRRGAFFSQQVFISFRM
jgi:hypothetical protein